MFTEQPLSRPGRSLQALLYAVGSTALAAGSVYLGWANIITIRYRTIYFPSWTFYVLAAALAGAAVVFALFSRAQRCLRCGGEWQEEAACFPLSARDEVLRAVNTSDTSALRALPVSQSEGSRIQVTVQACGRCATTGSVRVDRYDGDDAHSELTERQAEGPTVVALYELAAHHAEQRGDDE